MTHVTVDNVGALDAERRRRLEAVVGSPLESNQQVFIMVYTPNTVPTEEARRKAVANLGRLFDKADAHADRLGVTDDEIDAAVEAAIDHARRPRIG
jgi:hypothetical protein